MSAAHPCAKQIWRGMIQPATCTKAATKCEDDLWWCGSHAPSAVKRREAQRAVKLQHKVQDHRRQWAVQDALRLVGEDVWARHLSGAPLTPIETAYGTARAALRQATEVAP